MICHQYQIKEDTLKDALEKHGLTRIPDIKLSDTVFVPSEIDGEISQFIARYEWLGKMSLYPTHGFKLYWNDILICAVVMDMPTAFSNALGEDTKKLERLISRGSSISFAPKNTASFMIAKSIDWMTKNTTYRLFTGYSDPSAGELGTIYQALNFYYLGQTFGATKQYLYNGRWVSDRSFRSRSAYKRYAIALGITWNPAWQDGDKIIWENVPADIEKMLRDSSKKMMASLEFRVPKAKHKYALVKGANKRETRELKHIFESRNKTFNYPEESLRGS
jgi:hypothetical protein